MDKTELGREVGLLTREYKLAAKEGTVGYLKLAEMEEKLWNFVRELEGTNSTHLHSRRIWFYQNFGGKTSEYEIRGTLLKGEEAAHVLFERMDTGTMSHSMAKKILGKARQLGKQYGVDLDITVKSVLKQYKGSKSSVDRAKLDKVPSARKETAVRAIRDADTNFDPKEDPTKLSKQFKHTVMAATENYIKAMFANRNMSEALKSRMADDFRISMDQLIDTWRRDLVISKQQNREDSLNQISRAKFKWACEVLGLSYKFSDPIDIKKVNKKKLIRARNLHPDRNPTPEAEEEYLAVISAFDTLKQYDEVLPTNGRKAKESS